MSSEGVVVAAAHYDHSLWYSRAKQEASSSLQLAQTLKVEGNTSLVALQRAIEKNDTASIVKQGSAALHYYENGLRVVSSLYRDLTIMIDKVEGEGKSSTSAEGGGSIRSLLRGNNAINTTTSTTTTISGDVILHLATLASNYLQCIITVRGAMSGTTATSVQTGVFNGNPEGYIETAARRAHRVLQICEPICSKDFTLTQTATPPTLGVIVGKLILRLGRVCGTCRTTTITNANNKAMTIKQSESTATPESLALSLYRKLLPTHNPTLASRLLPSSQAERDSIVSIIEAEIKAIVMAQAQTERIEMSALCGKF